MSNPWLVNPSTPVSKKKKKILYRAILFPILPVLVIDAHVRCPPSPVDRQSPVASAKKNESLEKYQ